jgi:hypothetical protein
MLKEDAIVQLWTRRAAENYAGCEPDIIVLRTLERLSDVFVPDSEHVLDVVLAEYGVSSVKKTMIKINEELNARRRNSRKGDENEG